MTTKIINRVTGAEITPSFVPATIAVDFEFNDGSNIVPVRELVNPVNNSFNSMALALNDKSIGATSWAWEIEAWPGGDVPPIPTLYFTSQNVSAEDLAGLVAYTYAYKAKLTINGDPTLTIQSDYFYVVYPP